MNLLFIILPVAILAVTMSARLLSGVKPALSDERGVALETVIITAVLALAGAAAAVVIYNVVKSSGNEVKTNADKGCGGTQSALLASAKTIPSCTKTP